MCDSPDADKFQEVSVDKPMTSEPRLPKEHKVLLPKPRPLRLILDKPEERLSMVKDKVLEPATSRPNPTMPLALLKAELLLLRQTLLVPREPLTPLEERL